MYVYGMITGFKKTFISLCLTLCTCLAAVSQVNAEQVMSIGRNVLSMDDYMLSIQYFNLAIKAKPYLAEPYYYRGLAKLMLDDFDGAEQDCSKALERNKFLVEAYRVRGFSRARTGRDSLALEDFDAGLEYNPHDRYFLFYKAASLTSLKDWDGAGTAYETLFRSFPRFGPGYSERAKMYLAKGDTVLSLKDIETAISIDKNEVSPYLMRASVLAAGKKWEQAEADMDKAIDIMPKEASFYLNRAYIRYNSDDYFGAMSDYNYVLELEPDNMAALYNRALLRYEVRDMQRAGADFSRVLDEEPENFHARYCRAIINLDLGKNREAIDDFIRISRQMPRFYPLYYGIAQARQSLGDMRGAVAAYKKGEELVRGYVKNPKKNPLDRPAIQPGQTNTDGLDRKENESELDVMERFNRLITVSAEKVADKNISFNESIKGKVQDKDMKIEPEPYFMLTFSSPEETLGKSSLYFRDLDKLNARPEKNLRLTLTNRPQTLSEEGIRILFSRLDTHNSLSSADKSPLDLITAGLIHLNMKNYDMSLSELNEAVNRGADAAIAYFARAEALRGKARFNASLEENNLTSASGEKGILLQNAIDDLDQTLQIDPSLAAAWYNKGLIYLDLQDLTSALSSFARAIEINQNFGEAYYNRGLTYLRLGNKEAGLADLSKAGELGILPSYTLIKKMK